MKAMHAQSAPDRGTGVFTQAMPPIPRDAIARLLREDYGIECAALEMLSGERDLNYRVVDQAGTNFVCKLTHPSEPPGVTASQSRLLRELALVAPDLPVQHLVATRDGRECVQRPDGSLPTIRVLSYLHGTPAHQAQPSAALRRSLGVRHAELATALAKLDAIETAPDLLWDLSHIEQIEPLLGALRSEDDRALARQFLELHRAHALPAVASLRAQLIHNDLNPYNLLVDPAGSAICGILDFGDLVFAPLLNDVAIAASYLVPAEGDPLAGICDYLSAFYRSLPLQESELDTLFPLIGARLVMTVAITEWRAALHPENSRYILRNNPGARRGMRRLASIAIGQARDRFRQACREAGSQPS